MQLNKTLRIYIIYTLPMKKKSCRASKDDLRYHVHWDRYPPKRGTIKSWAVCCNTSLEATVKNIHALLSGKENNHIDTNPWNITCVSKSRYEDLTLQTTLSLAGLNIYCAHQNRLPSYTFSISRIIYKACFARLYNSTANNVYWLEISELFGIPDTSEWQIH